MDLKKEFFLLGIGGSGMSSLAHILLDAGLIVKGYDQKLENIPKKLVDRDIELTNELPKDLDAEKQNIVYSSAIKDNLAWKNYSDSSLLLEAYHRSKVLHSLFSQRKTISIAGSHGKTSTSAMVAQGLLEFGKDPSFMVGGEVFFNDSVGGRFGNGEWAVYESDESDGTFLNHSADIRILTNIDNDHLDYYGKRTNLNEAFLKYLGFERKGHIILQGDDPGIQEILLFTDLKTSDSFLFDSLTILISKDSAIVSKLVTLFPRADFVFFEIKNNSISFRMNEEKKDWELSLPFDGSHYLKNALCAFCAFLKTGLTEREALRQLENYKGVKRRQELLGFHSKGFSVYDDYGHHPTEIIAVEKALISKLQGKGRLVTVFQPHRFTRTQLLFEEFAESLLISHEVFLLPIYSAGESPIFGVTTQLIFDSILRKKPECKVNLLDVTLEVGAKQIASSMNKDDILLTIGAGNVRDWGEKILSKF